MCREFSGALHLFFEGRWEASFSRLPPDAQAGQNGGALLLLPVAGGARLLPAGASEMPRTVRPIAWQNTVFLSRLVAAEESRCEANENGV
jgi:hypothetical protein